jgi:predicted Ser/Thr protein kinase
MPTETRADGPAEQLLHACLELRRRLDAGEDCHAEDLLAAFPALASSEEHAVDLICTEVLARRQRGEAITPETWLDRFPRWRDRLQRQFRSHGLLVSGTTWEQSPPPTPDNFSLAADTETEAVPAAVRYEILGELGHGGMGVVYKARDRLLDRVVALKRIRNGPRAYAEEVQRFFREARALARLRHPHIVPVHDIGADGEEPFFTMDFVAGGSLKERRDLFGGDSRTIVALMEKVARAVHAAHEQGIIHRDLKPANVLLDSNGEPLVSDFGLAKWADAEESLTREGQIVGTPAYLAPELATGQSKDATAQSDVWSLGVMLYELLVQRRPYPGQRLPEVTYHLLTTELIRPRTWRAGVDAALERVVLACLAKEPGRRYSSASALADDLGRWLRGEPPTVRPLSWGGRTWRLIRRHPVVVAAAVVLPLVPLLVLAGLRADLGGRSLAPSDDQSPPGAERAQAPGGSRSADPDQLVKAYQLDLRAKRPAVLLGETGTPPWFRWALGQGVIRPSPQGDDTFSLSSFEPVFLELLPTPLPDRYLFEAEVFHHQSESGEVGIYFAHHQLATAQGVEHCCCEIVFNDWDPAARLAQFRLRRYRERGPLPALDYPASTGHSLDLGVLPRASKRDWRVLRARVMPQTIEVAWGAAWFGKLSRADLVKKAKFPLQDNPALQPQAEFLPQGGLGVSVQRGVASFRRVRVTPLE